MSDEAVIARLEALDRKLDAVLERQRFVDDLVDGMMPVVREVVRAANGPLTAWERDGVLDDVAALADRLPGLVAALRHLTEPAVLQVADEAGDVLAHAGEARPVGMVGAVRATADADVQRGLGVALELLRHLGRARTTSPAPMPREIHAHSLPADAPPPAPVTPPPAHVAPPPAPVPSEVVWEGVRFDGQGFLVDPRDWSEALAEKMAAALGVALTPEVWTVVRWVRTDWTSTGTSPNVRRTAAGSGLGVKRLYELFPKTPGKTAAMLAGVPKPAGCI